MKYILLLLFSFQLLHAQQYQIKGRVIDVTDNTPVAGAVVSVSGNMKAAISSENGSFAIEKLKPGQYTIKASLIGYTEYKKTIDISEQNDSMLLIGLMPSVENLETVVITGTRSEKRLKEVPVLTQVIQPNRLKDIGITSVNAALEHEVPGLNLSQFNYRQKVTFQGMNAKYLLFLIDGERIAGEMDGDIDYFRLNLDNVERIEVVRGASSALYGSNAIGGVINIITKNQDAALDGNAYARYSDYNEFAGGSSFGIKRDKLISQTGFSYNQTDGYHTPGDTLRTMTQEKMKNAAVTQKICYSFSEKMKITANGNLFYNSVFDGTVIPTHHAYAGAGGYIKALYSRNSYNIELTHAADNYTAYNVYFKNNNKHSKYSTDWQQNTRLLGNISTLIGQIIAGLEYKAENIYSFRVKDTTQYASERIVFFQDDYKLNQHFSFVAGLRATHHSQYKLNFTPKISAMAGFSIFIFRASYGLGFRSPSLKEMYYDFDHMGTFRLTGNPNLKPEKSKYTGFSIEMNLKRNNLSVNLYHNRVEDMIVNNWIEPKVGQYVNIATARILGIDLMERFILSKKIQLSGGISLVDAQDISKNKQIYDISPVSINGNARYSFSILKEQSSVELFGKYTGRRYYEPVGEYYYEDSPYQTWKFTFTQHYKNILTCSLGIDNIFDVVEPNSLGNISPGRRYFISVSYRFVKY